MSTCSVPVAFFVYWKLGEVTSKENLSMLCKAKCVARMGTPDSSHHHLIARLWLPCCSFSISAWNKTRGKAENSEQCPNAVWGCCMPPSLLGRLHSISAADPLPCPPLFPAGAVSCWHQGSWPSCWSSPWGLPGWPGRRHHIPPAGVVWGAGGEHLGGRGMFTGGLLGPRGALLPPSALGGCCVRHSWLDQALGINLGWKGYPKKTVLPCKVCGGCSAVPMPAPCHMELQPPYTQIMCCLPPARARAAKGS